MCPPVGSTDSCSELLLWEKRKGRKNQTSHSLPTTFWNESPSPNPSVRGARSGSWNKEKWIPVMSLAQEVAGRSLIKNDRAVVIPWWFLTPGFPKGVVLSITNNFKHYQVFKNPWLWHLGTGWMVAWAVLGWCLCLNLDFRMLLAPVLWVSGGNWHFGRNRAHPNVFHIYFPEEWTLFSGELCPKMKWWQSCNSTLEVMLKGRGISFSSW